MNKIIYALLAAAVFGSGYYMSSLKHERDFTQYKLEQEELYSDLLNRHNDFVRKQFTFVQNVEQERIKTTSELESKYEKIIADMRRDFKPSGVFKCPAKGKTTTDANDTADVVCYTRSQLRSKIERTLAIGREADELAVKYSTLIKIVEDFNNEAK